MCVFFFGLCLFHVFFSILILSIFIFFLFSFVFFFYFLFQKNSDVKLICFIIKVIKKKLLYFCLIRWRFEVWKKKTNLIFFFQVWFFFSFFCSLFCFLFFLIYFLIFFYDYFTVFPFFVSCLNIFILYVFIFFLFLRVKKSF